MSPANSAHNLSFSYLPNQIDFELEILHGRRIPHHVHVIFFQNFRGPFYLGLHSFSPKMWFALHIFPHSRAYPSRHLFFSFRPKMAQPPTQSASSGPRSSQPLPRPATAAGPRVHTHATRGHAPSRRPRAASRRCRHSLLLAASSYSDAHYKTRTTSTSSSPPFLSPRRQAVATSRRRCCYPPLDAALPRFSTRVSFSLCRRSGRYPSSSCHARKADVAASRSTASRRLAALLWMPTSRPHFGASPSRPLPSGRPPAVVAPPMSSSRFPRAAAPPALRSSPQKSLLFSSQ